MQDHIGHREPTETKSRYENLLLKRPEEENAPLPTKLFGDLTIFALSSLSGSCKKIWRLVMT